MKVMLAALSAFAAVAMSGCAIAYTPSWPERASLVEFDKGGSAVLITATEGEMGCTNANLRLLNSNSKADAGVITGTGDAAANIVSPGKWRPYYIDCFDDQYQPLPNVAMWFAPVEVKPGEVVYLGTLRAEPVRVQREMPVITQILNLGLAGNSITDSFVVYEYRDNTAAVREQVRKKNPALASRMVTRIPSQILSRKAFIDAYQNAYKPGPDGKLPTEAEVDARFKEEIRKAVDKSMTEYILKEGPELQKRDAPMEARPPPPPPVHREETPPTPTVS